MANLYVQTLNDARQAALELASMGSEARRYSDGASAIEGWPLVDLDRRDKTWDDGDWRSESWQAVIGIDGALWLYYMHWSYGETSSGRRERRDYSTLTRMTPAYLRETDVQGGYFRKIRGQLKNLV